MKASTQKLTTAAVCTALAVIMCALTAFLPLSFMPLYLAAFCIFLACKRGSVAYGVLSALASTGLMFLMSGLSVKWLSFVVVFAPYGILAHFMQRFGYFKLKQALVRAAVMVVYFNATVAIVYAVAVNVLSVGIEGLNIAEWASRLGGYAVLALVATLVLMPLDFIFSSLAVVVLKKIPAPVTRLKPPVTERGTESDGTRAPRLDIFGYEIRDGEENDNGNNDNNGDNADNADNGGNNADGESDNGDNDGKR